MQRGWGQGGRGFGGVPLTPNQPFGVPPEGFKIMMAFSCPHCGVTFHVEEVLAGQTRKCPTCRTMFVVPHPPRRCYYCTGSIPSNALVCPSCGKKCKELYDIRLERRSLLIFCIIMPWLAGPIIAICARERWQRTSFYGLRSSFSEEAMMNDWLFWGLLVVFFVGSVALILLEAHYRSSYARLSGKKIQGW